MGRCVDVGSGVLWDSDTGINDETSGRGTWVSGDPGEGGGGMSKPGKNMGMIEKGRSLETESCVAFQDPPQRLEGVLEGGMLI